MDQIVTWDNYALVYVRVSNAPDPKDRAAENDFHAMNALDDAVTEIARHRLAGTPQERFLIAARAVTTAQNGGRRDEDAESRAMHLYWKHNGMRIGPAGT